MVKKADVSVKVRGMVPTASYLPVSVHSLHDEQNAIKRLISERVGENNFQGKYLNGCERY